MMTIKNATFAIALALGFAATSAQAAITPTITEVTKVFSAPDSALTGYTAYQVNVTSDDGNISAVDIKINGPMHQRWSDVNFDGVPDPSPVGAIANGRGDSHFTPVDGALVAAPYTENNNVTESTLADINGLDYGNGDSLTAAWGIPGASQSESATIAYLVVPDSMGNVVNYEIATPNGVVSGAFSVGGDTVPEPTSFALAGLGMIGLGGFRRRNG